MGSVGQRHHAILTRMGLAMASASDSFSTSEFTSKTLDEGIINWNPEYVVVSNDTGKHQPIVMQLASLGFRGKLLVEKPLAFIDSTANVRQFKSFNVGFNLRFHPLIQKLNRIISDEEIIVYGGDFYYGRDLRYWRKESLREDSYSRIKAKGGGVLRDLSHELDLYCYLFGSPSSLQAMGGRFSNITADSDDNWTIVLRNKTGAIFSIRINYLDTRPTRSIRFFTSKGTILVDLEVGKLEFENQLFEENIAPDSTYEAMHSEIIAGNQHYAANYYDGHLVDSIISRCEAASAERGSEWNQ